MRESSAAIKMISLLWLFGFSFFWAMPTNASELSGVVKSESGRLLAGVKVLTYAPLPEKRDLLGATLTTQRYETATDKNGFFRLPSHGRLVYFRRDDLRPLTKTLGLSATRIEVTMEEGAPTLWRIPSCSLVADSSQRIGIAFKVLVPENILVKKATQFENGGYLFGYSIQGNIETLIIWSDSTSLEPN